MNFSKQIVETIKHADFSAMRVTVIGYGSMGKEYVKALRALKVAKILVCSRREEFMMELQGMEGVTCLAGGYENLKVQPGETELAIIAVPVEGLIPAAHFLKELGYKKFLIEKPVSLYSVELELFAQNFETPGIEVFCAYNRVAYPSLLEARGWIEEEGGVTSCCYTLTEMVRKDWTERFSACELARWGASNTIHVISMAHAVIGLPETWKNLQAGSAISWHPSGSVFAGFGMSQKNILFSYHADWSSKGRWSVELYTKKAAYRFCPLEKLFRKEVATRDWEEVPLQTFAPEVKVGCTEQVAAALDLEIRKKIGLVSLREALKITQFAENIFGYSQGKIDA